MYNLCTLIFILHQAGFSQNFTILLKKFKRTNEEMMDIILSCDKDNLISLDMWEQVRFISSRYYDTVVSGIRISICKSISVSAQYFLDIFTPISLIYCLLVK